MVPGRCSCRKPHPCWSEPSYRWSRCCTRAPARPAVPARAPGSAADRALDPGPGAAAGPRESRVGVSPGARRAAGARGEGRGFHRLGDPARWRDRPGARVQLRHVGRFPALPGRGPAGLRLLRGGHPVQGAAIRARGDRARQPQNQDPGCHRAPDGSLGDAGGPEPRDGLGGCRLPGTVPDQGLGREVPGPVRCHPR